MRSVVFVLKKRQLASSRVRVLDLIPGLEKRGIIASVTIYPRTFIKKIFFFLNLYKHDIVFIQKTVPRIFIFNTIRKFSKRLVFDFDDAIFSFTDRESDENEDKYIKFINVVKKSDLVIAGNPILAKEAFQYADKVEVLPSAVKINRLKTYSCDAVPCPCVIGWVGYGHNLHHLLIAGEALKKLAREYPIELRVISDNHFELDGVVVKNIPWDLSTQYSEISKFDIGIMPLPKNSWTKGKCSYKALQYMATGVPVVATNWGYNSYVIEDGKNGLLAENSDEFYEKLKFLIDNPSSAHKIGVAGHSFIEQEYSIEIIGARLANLLLQL